MGRDFLRCVSDRKDTGIEVVAVNDITQGILRYTEAPVVSRDIIGDPASCVFDASLTMADRRLVKVFGWYDNEWGYASRTVDLIDMIAKTL